ncbi:MAG: 50S ribosomal protein L32 [Chitinophagales bacterium]|nr:50S ribosomal protein L32 [Chitinophagales bacterium]MDW8428033.1 50S ribosomal protein L32 [Chitinophagales bacterium]
MPNPKRRHSKSRQRKRRTHDKLTMPTLSVDPTTGMTHVRHRAHYFEGELYYRGKKILGKTS